MASRNHSHTTTSSYASFRYIDDWISSIKAQPIPSKLQLNPELNAEIHRAIDEQPSEYASTICDHLLTLYRETTYKPFVLQFLPSFITAYYEVLHYHHHHHQRSHPESVDAKTKDVYSTINTFLLSLYSLGVIDYREDVKNNGFRIPDITHPSIYHVPNLDHYTPSPLTRLEISLHENKPELIRPHSFVPFDSVNASNREQIIWFLLVQYGKQVSEMDESSYHAYIRMATKILAQGFPFDPVRKITNIDQYLKFSRIKISSEMMTEMLGTLVYIKVHSKFDDAVECMRLLRKRGEFELYADVMIMTESLEFLHEFDENHTNNQCDIGIEIEPPLTAEMTRQKRAIALTRSNKNQNRYENLDDSVSDENSITDSPTVVSEKNEIKPSRRRGILNSTDNTFHEEETNHRSKSKKNTRSDMNQTPTIDEARTSMTPAMGSVRSKTSPAIDHHNKPTFIRDVSPALSNSSRKTNKSLTPNDFDSSLEKDKKQSNKNTKTSRRRSSDRKSNSNDIQETRF